MLSPWTLHSQSPPIYCRPLGLTEEAFYWDAQFEGTADDAQIVKVKIRQVANNDDIFSPKNIERAWISLKCQYPILGSRIQRHEDGSLYFFVDENYLRSCGETELHYHSVGSTEEANAIAFKILNSPRTLCDNVLACLFVLRQTDNPNLAHFLIHSPHLISDIVGKSTQVRTFLDNLARAGPPLQTWNIRERLAISISSEDLFPARHLSMARQRWRRATGAIIFARRLSKVSGGHTLPRKFTKLTRYQPAYSRTTSRLFTKEETSSIIESCRYLGLTFGVVLPVLGQVAIARLLCRRYVQGKIDEEEWEFRKKEPMVNFAPMNLRPFLDKEWHDRGGATNASLHIGYFDIILPFMPLGAATNIKPGSVVPSYSNLLSKERFRLRCQNVKKQVTLVLQNPLLCEINIGWLPLQIQDAKQVAENWKHKLTLNNPSDYKIMAASEQARANAVYSHGGSSFGCMDSMYPQTYPLSDMEPKLELISGKAILGSRPGELYLGASTIRQQLRITTFFDGNCYEPCTVEEWLDEVRDAIDHFLINGKGRESTLDRKIKSWLKAKLLVEYGYQ